MGYYTHYTLKHTASCCEATEDLSPKILAELVKREYVGWVLNPEFTVDNMGVTHFGSYESGKWYGHEAEFKEVAKLFPTVTFKLSGVGQGEGDYWNEYFCGDKSEHCKGTMTVKYEECRLAGILWEL